jgi:protein-tyrosine phosphatase
MDTTLRMAQAAADQGVTTICCTPHLLDFEPDLIERVRSVHKETEAALAEAGIPVRLLCGFEVDLLVAATTDLDTMRTLCIQNPDLPAGESRALLVEMPYSNWPPFFEETIYRLATAGFLPIIAHPERNGRVQRSPDAIQGCINSGAILQGTSGSLSPNFRKQSQKTFLELLARGSFSLLASDAHADPEYTWTLGPLLAELGDRISPEDRDLLVRVNPGSVLEGRRPIPLTPKRPQGKTRRFFGGR